MEFTYVIIGLAMIYSTVHFLVIQKRGWTERSSYERVVSVFAMVSISLVYLSVMFAD